MDYYYDYEIPMPAPGADDDDGDYDAAMVDYDESLLLDEEVHSLYGAVHICLLPSITQIGSYILTLLACSLLCRLTWWWLRMSGGIRRICRNDGDWLQHCASIACGFTALYLTTGRDCLIVLFLSLVAYILMLILEYRNCRAPGVLVTIITIGSQFAYEALWNKPATWQHIRGIQMVATLKIVSLAFDSATFQDQKEKAFGVPPLVPFLGYLFCPASCVLGPWMPYSSYTRSLYATNNQRPQSRWLLWTVLNALAAVFFLGCSNCLVPLLCSESAWKWFRTYRDALSVRCSHYFICFLSQATLSATGVTLYGNAAPNALFGHMVTKPWVIEMPRSLGSLVRSWNIPMHDWLKMYVYRASLQRFGGRYLIALVGTYLVSSLLHGFHGKIYLVLLSLGCFAYAESVLRAKLATVFNACIASDPCRRTTCHFLHCPTKRGWRSRGACAVLLVNGLFSALSILHLAYLGVVMSGTDIEDEDAEWRRDTVASIKDGLSKWSQLDYLSHWLALVTYIFYYLV